jgi:hypothetical protein
MHNSLAASSIESAQLLDNLTNLLRDSQYEERTNLRQSDLEDQSARFRVWAGNLGAFQKLPSTSSLEHRLREAPKVAEQIYELLQDLHDAAQNGMVSHVF